MLFQIVCKEDLYENLLSGRCLNQLHSHACKYKEINNSWSGYLSAMQDCTQTPDVDLYGAGKAYSYNLLYSIMHACMETPIAI